MELLKNGDFLVDLNDPDNGWTVEGDVERVADGGVGDAGGFFVSFKGRGSIRQTINLKSARPNFMVSNSGARVQNGEEDYGRVRVDMKFHSEGGASEDWPFLILESKKWIQGMYGSTYPTHYDFLTVTYTVTKDDKVVSLRRLSLADEQLQGVKRIDTKK